MQSTENTELVSNLVDIYVHAPYFTKDDEKDLMISLAYISMPDDKIACILQEIQEKRATPNPTVDAHNKSKPTPTTKESLRTQSPGSTITPEMKKNIVAAYMYQPVKPTPKNLFLRPETKQIQKARYRDGKIVTLKGEKFV